MTTLTKKITLVAAGALALLLPACTQSSVQGTGNVESLERQPKPAPDNDFANQAAGRNAVDYANDRRRYGYGYSSGYPYGRY